jgi:hypothetical protein
MTMKYSILSIITAFGLLIPLLWIGGTVTSIIYFYLHKEKEQERTFALDPHLGFTMADGGDPIDVGGKR